MVVVVVDGLGGGLGTQIVSQLSGQSGVKAEIIAIGTNAIATQNMIKAGAARGATGENAMRLALKKAGVVIGPIGIVIPHALMGEITPGMAEMIASCDAQKILLPVSQTHVEVIGIETKPLVTVIKDAVARVVCLVQAEEV